MTRSQIVASFCLVSAVLLLAGHDPDRALARAATDRPESAATTQLQAPTSGQLRVAFTTFLRSREGIIATVLVFGALGVGALLISYRSMSSISGSGGVKTPPSRRARRQRGRGPSDRSGRDLSLSLVLAAILVAACFLLPLIFTIALADVFAQPKSQLLWFVAVVALTVLVIAFVRGVTPRRFGVLDIGLVGFAFLTIFATFFSIDLNQSLKGERLQYQGLLSIGSYVVLFVAARWSIADDNRARVLSAALLASAAIAAVYAIAQWFSLDPIWDALFKGRVFSTVGQANALASMLGMAAVSTIGLIAVAGRRRLIFLAIALVFVAAAFVLTFSRGAYLAVPFGLGTAAIVLAAGGVPASIRAYARRAAIGVTAAALLVVVVAASVPAAGSFVGRVVDRVTSIPNTSESSNRSHLDLWEVGLRIASEHPILGTGPDTYVLLFAQYRDDVLTPERAEVMKRFRPESAHNVYISTAAGSGIPSLIAYLLIIGGVLSAVLRAARREIPASVRFALAGLAGGAVIHVVTDGFMTGEPSSAAVFWVLLGSAAGLAERHLDGGRSNSK